MVLHGAWRGSQIVRAMPGATQSGRFAAESLSIFPIAWTVLSDPRESLSQPGCRSRRSRRAKASAVLEFVPVFLFAVHVAQDVGDSQAREKAPTESSSSFQRTQARASMMLPADTPNSSLPPRYSSLKNGARRRLATTFIPSSTSPPLTKTASAAWQVLSKERRSNRRTVGASLTSRPRIS